MIERRRKAGSVREIDAGEVLVVFYSQVGQ